MSRKSPYRAPRKEKPSAGENKGPSEDQADFSVAKAVSALENTVAQKADANREETRREDRISKFIEIATLFFVILTTGGIFYQAHILHSSDVAFQKSATAAKDAADAAKSAVELSDKTTKRQLRAYVGPVAESFSLVCHECKVGLTDDGTFYKSGNGLFYKLKNYGPTPTIDVSVCGGLTPVGPNDNDQLSMEKAFKNCIALGVEPNQPNLWPQEERRQVGKFGSIENLVDVLQRRKKGYLHGRTTYRDIFGSLHHTYICRELIFSSDGVMTVIGCDTGPNFRDD
jgi:hypothetical protein